MPVFNQLNAKEVNQPTNEIYVIYTGKKHRLTDEQEEKCQAYLDHLNEERETKGLNPINNGDVYTIVDEQRTSDGKQLYLTEKTTYAHFLAFRDQNSEVAKKIFGATPIPACPVGNPQAIILPIPETVAARKTGKGIKDRILASVKSKGPEVVLGIMGSQTAFEGTVQAFGAGLNGKNMSAIKPEDILQTLKEAGFNVNTNDITPECRMWDLGKIIEQSLQSQAGISKDEHADPIRPLVAVRDDKGNLYCTHLIPVKKTIGKIKDEMPQSKFSGLISLPIDLKRAMSKLDRLGLDYRVYVPPAIERIREMFRTRSNAEWIRNVIEKVKSTTNKLPAVLKSNPERDHHSR